MRRNGLIAMDLEPGDALVSARMARSTDELVMATADGQAIRFPVSELRMASRASGGVRGVKLAPGDYVVGMEVAIDDHHLFTISEHGYGKRTPFTQYPTQKRGGGGVLNMKITDKTGRVAAIRPVNGTRELIIITGDGIVLRTTVDAISVIGRATQGVSIIRPRPGDTVAAIAGIEGPEEETPAPRRRGKSAEPDEAAAPASTLPLMPGLEDGVQKARARRNGRNGTS